MFQKKKKKNDNDKKKQQQQQHHQDKNKTGASLGGLFLWLSLGSFLGKLNKSDLEILRALTKVNSLKGLNKKGWLLGMRGSSTTVDSAVF